MWFCFVLVIAEMPIELYNNAGLTCAIDVLLVILMTILDQRGEQWLAHGNGNKALLWILNRRTDLSGHCEKPQSVRSAKLGEIRSLFYHLLRHNYTISRWNYHLPMGRQFAPFLSTGPPVFKQMIDIRDTVRLLSIFNNDCTIDAIRTWNLAKVDQLFVNDATGPREHEYCSSFAPLCIIQCTSARVTCSSPTIIKDSVLSMLPHSIRYDNEPRRKPCTINEAVQFCGNRTRASDKCACCKAVLTAIPVPVQQLPNTVILEFYAGINGSARRQGLNAICVDQSILTFTFNTVQFDLMGVIYYHEREKHYTCELMIRGQWYYYDDLNNNGVAQLRDEPFHRPSFKKPGTKRVLLRNRVVLLIYARRFVYFVTFSVLFMVYCYILISWCCLCWFSEL